MKVRIYVEGGPKGADADGVRAFRNAFKKYFQQLDPRLKSLDVISYGSTDQTIKSYADGLRQFSASCSIALLVDADEPVTARTPAIHLQSKLDSAKVPQNARQNIFLMVQCMEAWLVTDESVLQACFGNKLRTGILPQNPDIEAVSKRDVLSALDAAIKPTPTGRYHKVEHGARLLAKLNPNSVGSRSRHARDLHAFLLSSVQA
ncbi:MAG: DUF4276 family protein [Terracidiphilus sp.]